MVLTMRSSQVELHLAEETGIVCERHLALGRDKAPIESSAKCFYWHQGTTTHRSHETVEGAMEEARAQGWR